MDEQANIFEQQQPQPIESASGTTSPDNSNSGYFAYIVTAICVVLIIFLSAAATGCIKNAASLAVGLTNFSTDNVDVKVVTPEGERDLDDFDGDSFEDYFYEVFGVPYSDPSSRDRSDRDSNSDKTYTPLEVLSLNLCIYGDTVNDLVSANAYAGSDADVRDFVRSLIIADRDSTSELIYELRAAGRDEEDFDASIENACAIAEDVLDALDAVETPDADETTQAYLDEAIDDLKGRWEGIDYLMEALKVDGELSYDDLVKIDDAIYDSTVEAADALEAALHASAK